METMDDMNLAAGMPAADAELFHAALVKLRSWLEQERFAGVEPHDALTSPLMERTPLGRSRFLRLASLQGLRRLPVNIRPALGIRPRINAISLGWGLKAYALLDDPGAPRWIDWSLERLREAQAEGYSGAGWGYYFGWQTRSGMKPANLPIIVSTAFIGSGLLDIFDRYGREDCLAWARSACNFILRDLNRSPGRIGFCFSYSPKDNEQVFNASMLGAQLLARVGAITGEPELMDAARAAVDFAVDHQSADGSWHYGLAAHWDFIDNFHTGYVLCCLRDYIRDSGDARHQDALEKGWEFYRSNFFAAGAIPKYYHNRLYPIDAHAAAQAIVTLLDFGDVAMARSVAGWTIRHLQVDKGYFIYQIHSRYSNRIPYLRWSNAWMFYALARLNGIN